MHHRTVKRTKYSPRVVAFGRGLLGLFGWRVEGGRPEGMTKCVILGVPHTTNWDLPVMLLASFAMRLPAVFMMKDTWFWWPMGAVWRWLGGIPVNRRSSTSAVDQMLEAFRESEHLSLVIAPEGTRKAVRHWKLGFYWMAVGAGVPILPGYVDYQRKVIGIGPPIYPTGEIEADFAALRTFYEAEVGVTPSFDPKALQSKRNGCTRMPMPSAQTEGARAGIAARG